MKDFDFLKVEKTIARMSGACFVRLCLALIRSVARLKFLPTGKKKKFKTNLLCFLNCRICEYFEENKTTHPTIFLLAGICNFGFLKNANDTN